MYPILEKIFTSEEKSIQSLLINERHFKMKDNQRHFAWETKEVEQFWLDFLNVYEKNTFENSKGELSIDVDPKQYFFGILVFSESRKFYEVIDGQQRLTVTSVFLKLLWNISKRITDTTKSTFLSNVFQQMLMPQEFPINISGEQRIYPDPAVAVLYKEYILGDESSRRNYEQNKLERIKEDTAEFRLLNAYNFFKGKLDEEFPVSMSEDEIYSKISLYMYTIGHLFTVLKITVKEEGTAYTIFETVNNRGKDLSKSDLIKNSLFTSISDPAKNSSINDYWNNIVNNTASEDLTDYIRFHYISKHKAVRPMQLHEEIKTHILSNDPYDYLKELETESEWYGAITLQNTGFWSSGDISQKLKEFKKIDVTACIPLLLTGAALYHGEEDEFRKLVNSTLVFAFRFFTVGDNSVDRLEREIGLMARALRKAEDLSSKTTEELVEIEEKEPHRKIKDLDSLIHYMKNKTPDTLFESNFKKFRTSSGTLAGYILTEIQLPKLSAGISITHGMDLQVEHIMPKTPSNRRINEWDHVRNEPDFKHYLTRLGNLMILEGALNRACTNKTFQIKLDEYEKSQLTIPKDLNTFFTTGIWATKTPTDRELAWSFDAIESRQIQLAAEALEVWKY